MYHNPSHGDGPAIATPVGGTASLLYDAATARSPV